MTIAERLGEIDLSSRKGAGKGTASLQTDNFAVLLVQGLESNDAHILNVSTFPLPRFKNVTERGGEYTFVNQLKVNSHVNNCVSAITESFPDS